ncbi:MAG TPA: hypothetical protein VNI61_08435, partial [Gemmatimonadales bacterium]|nr:hypothetical protein [Gemmatimonadales bacterium]
MAAVLHVGAVAALLFIPLRRLTPPTYIVLAPLEATHLPPYGGTRAGGGRPGGVRAAPPDSARGALTAT